MLRDHGYSLQAPSKSVEGAQHPDRNAQFEHINTMAETCIKQGHPVISVDTKKKKLVGNFKNGGESGNPRAFRNWSTFTTFPATRSARPLVAHGPARFQPARRSQVWAGGNARSGAPADEYGSTWPGG